MHRKGENSREPRNRSEILSRDLTLEIILAFIMADWLEAGPGFYSKLGRPPSRLHKRHTLAGVVRLEGPRAREVRRAPGGVRTHTAGTPS